MIRPMDKNEEIYEQVKKHLTSEFERRCQQNSRYSLRAFARSLSVDSSYLSKILSGKRKLSRHALSKLAERIHLPAELMQSVKKPTQTDSFTSLEVEHFRLIANWYHYAILEMTRLSDFRPDPKWISAYLGINQAEALAAIERLKECGLLEVTASGHWKILNNTTTQHPFTHLAFRQLQRQILEQAIGALENVPIEERDQSSITMCIDKKRIARAKQKIKNFRRELMSYLEGGENKDAVYQLSISLFPAGLIYKKEPRT